MRVSFAASLVLVLAAVSARAEEKKPEPKAADLPVKATLTAKKASYPLGIDPKNAEEFKKSLKDAEKTGKVPPSPKVDLVLELKNTSDKDVQIWISGDPVQMGLELKGKGAISIMARLAFTREFRIPKAVTLKPGKTHEIPITSLTYGFRGVAEQAYWTEVGEYTLAASFKTGISPAPKGTKDNGDGFGMCVIKSEPIKITVEAPK